MKTIRALVRHAGEVIHVRATDCGFEKSHVHCWRALVDEDVICLQPKERGVTWVLDKPGEREVLEAINKLVRSA